MDSNVFEWLWLVSCIGCGNRRIWEIMSAFSSVNEAYEALNSEDIRHRYLTESECRSALRVTRQQVESMIEYCEKNKIYILTIDDEVYPERLKSITNPPALLFCRGQLECLEDDFSISVVGTRKPSDYSVRFTSELVKYLSGIGMTVVSGFAVGIDITASLSAVRNGGKTIAVLGCGIDHDYPKENFRYRNEIEENGLFISEYFPKAGGSAITFPARNRILSGLTLGTIVAEASAKSGSLITAGLALSQGKDIFAVSPHNLFSSRYGGNVALIRDGAICLCGARDIVYEYYENYKHKIANAKIDIPIELPDNKKKPRKQPAKKARPAEAELIPEIPLIKSEFDSSLLGEDEAKVYNAVKEFGKPVLADEIAEKCGIDISELLMILTDLELDGAISAAAGNMYTAN